MSQKIRPLIGLPACVVQAEGMPFHKVGDKYVRAVSVGAGGLPMMFPSLGHLIEPEDLVDRLDGLMLTGSPSNVFPTHYGEEPHPGAEPHDQWRDETTLPLIKLAIERGVPLFAICRGFQELNVALGGTLHARLQEVEGRFDHRRPKSDDLDVQYGEVHSLSLTPGGIFAKLLGREEIRINSLHGQGIKRLAEGLTLEGTAPDGTIEAVSVTGAKAFALGVQWHPEYKCWENEISMTLFRAFGEAAAQRAAARAEGRLRLAS
ncbi:gamma-glutamyl-gamma-aminobutyrate hydrolase family protein [Limibacillus halophilus]